MSAEAHGKRPAFLIAVPLILGCMLVVLLFMIMTRVILQPSNWRAQVDHYLQYRGGLAFVSAGQASLPRQFTAEMSRATFGDSVYYITDLHLGQAAGPRPLPYPPDEVWCVVLRGSDGSSVVFVARHSDLYNSDWVTHEPAGDPAAIMARIGCR